MDQGADFSKLKINYRGKEISPLTCALELLSLPCIDFILKTNPGLAQQPLESGMLPLTHALERSSIEAVALLLASQADPYRSKKEVETIVELLISNYGSKREICENVIKCLRDKLPVVSYLLTADLPSEEDLRKYGHLQEFWKASELIVLD